MKRTYKITEDGYFQGTWRAKDTKLTLHPKEAKYGVLSGQLVEVVEVRKPAVSVTNKAPRRTRGERSTRRTVGGSSGLST